MADGPTADELRDGLGYVCEHLDRLRDRLARYGNAALLDALLDAEAPATRSADTSPPCTGP